MNMYANTQRYYISNSTCWLNTIVRTRNAIAAIAIKCIDYKFLLYIH